MPRRPLGRHKCLGPLVRRALDQKENSPPEPEHEPLWFV